MVKQRAALLAAVTLGAVSPSLLPSAAAADEGGQAISAAVRGAIDPGAERTLERTLDHALSQRAKLVILRLDTPGGYATSMREMVTAIAGAPMPVVVYVHPSGARADSAGLILTLAADVAAMAPLTNIGSATPVYGGPPARTPSEDQLLRDLRRKAINDGVAFARTLAEDHGRNADLAEQMIRAARNVSATVAHREGLVDVLAPTEQALLRSLDGFAVKGQKAQTLQTNGLEITSFSDSVGVDEFDSENSSFWRSFAYIFGAAGALTLTVVGSARGRKWWRRRQRKRRRMRAQRP